MSPADILSGYEILGLIGESSTAEVYRARDLALDRDVAVKVLKREIATPHGRQRFLTGARIQASLIHPGIVPLHCVGELPDRRPYLVMKLIRGRSLAEILAERLQPRLDMLVQLFLGVCRAIAYAHSRHVIHRNIKPGSIMIGAFGEIMVIGWGSGTVLDSFENAGVVGTSHYMPPEQARGQPADCRSDVFGLGGVMCHILTGGPPFDSGNEDDALKAASAGDLTRAFTHLDGCEADPELVALCRRCLSPDPGGRPSSAADVARTISALLPSATSRLA